MTSRQEQIDRHNARIEQLDRYIQDCEAGIENLMEIEGLRPTQTFDHVAINGLRQQIEGFETERQAIIRSPEYVALMKRS